VKSLYKEIYKGIFTCILVSKVFCPACSMFSEPAISTSISRPPTVGTSRIIYKKQNNKQKIIFYYKQQLVELVQSSYHAVAPRTSIIAEGTLNNPSLLHFLNLLRNFSSFSPRYISSIFSLFAHNFKSYLQIRLHTQNSLKIKHNTNLELMNL